LRYAGAGKRIVNALKYGGYTRVIEKVAAPLMLGVRAAGMRFAPSCRCRLTGSRIRKREFNQAKLLASGVARKLNAPVSDTLEVMRSTRDQVELSAAESGRTSRARAPPGGPVLGRILLVDDVFTTGVAMSAWRQYAAAHARACEVHALSLCRTV
jgi:predicted amidophosphoribosyltransferase